LLSKEEEEVNLEDFKINDEDIEVVDEFLSKFCIVSENSINEHLDIFLMLRALPNKVMDYNLEATE
jgi:hypothetical protein